MLFGHSRFRQRGPIRPLNDYSCSPPGVGAVSVAPSVLVFFFELFLLEGLVDDSAEGSSLVDFSALVAFSPLVDFFEPFVLDGLPVVSAPDSSPVPFIIWSPL